MDSRTCKHFTGGALTGLVCRAGVKYSDVTPNPSAPGSAYRAPCRVYPATDRHAQECIANGGQGTCAKREMPTAEEVRSWEEIIEAEIAESIRRFAKAGPLFAQIKREHKGEDWSGAAPCPACEIGTLQIVHSARNGHLAVRCSTSECLSFIE